MLDWLLWFLLAFAIANGACWVLWFVMAARSRSGLSPQLMAAIAGLAAANERMEREIRLELQGGSREIRTELTQNLSVFQQALLAQSGDVARTQNEQIDSCRVQLGVTQQQLAASQAAAREAQDMALKRFADGLNELLRQVSEGNERKL